MRARSSLCHERLDAAWLEGIADAVAAAVVTEAAAF